MLPEQQSDYRAYLTTETTVIEVLDDILRAVDMGDLIVLTQLVQSAAFDTDDNATLLHRLNVSCAAIAVPS